jgi:Flp pilus assembly protein protease CpaA
MVDITKVLLENWAAVLAILGGVIVVIGCIFGFLLIWKKAGGGDIKAPGIDIDVDGK